jgi:hypothetical protein
MQAKPTIPAKTPSKILFVTDGVDESDSTPAVLQSWVVPDVSGLAAKLDTHYKGMQLEKSICRWHF